MAVIVIRLYKGANFPDTGSILVIGYWGSQEAESPITPVAGGFPRFYCDLAFAIRTNDERIAMKLPVVVNCYHLTEKSTKSKIGSIELDIFHLSKTCKGFELQTDGTSSSQPAVLFLASFIEGADGFETLQAHDVKPEIPVTTKLNPVLVNDEYFCLGNPLTENLKLYTLSLTLVFAENLLKVFPLDNLLPPLGTEFSFASYLIGHPAIYHTFTDLGNPISVQERAYTRVLTKPEYLVDYLVQKIPYLTLSFCCNSFAVAETKIPLGKRINDENLQKTIEETIDLEPFKMSGTYKLVHMFSANQTRLDERETSRAAVVGVTVSLAPALSTEIPKDLLSPGNQVPKNQTEQQSCSPNASNQTSVLLSPSLEAERKKMLYSMSLELELWKEEQMKIIDQQTKERQKQQLELLNAEYLRQVAKKDLIHKERMKKCDEMERQLTEAIQKAEERERNFNRLEGNLRREISKLREEHAKTMETMKSQFEKQRETENRHYTTLINELNRKIQQLQLEFQQKQKKQKTED